MQVKHTVSYYINKKKVAKPTLTKVINDQRRTKKRPSFPIAHARMGTHVTALRMRDPVRSGGSIAHAQKATPTLL